MKVVSQKGALQAERKKKEVNLMNFDDSLLTGLFLGITIGLFYAGALINFMPFFVLLSLIFLVRYLHHVR